MSPDRSRAEGHRPPDQQVAVSLNAATISAARRRFWLFVALAIALWLAYLVREIWLPLGIAAVMAMVLDPVVDRMETRGWSRTAATACIFAAALGALGSVAYFAVPAAIDQANAISASFDRYLPRPGHRDEAERSLRRLLDRAKAPAYAREAVRRGAAQVSHALTSAAEWVSRHTMDVLSNLIWIAIIPIVTFYLLRDFHTILGKGLLLVPRPQRDLVQALVSEVAAIFTRYLRGLALLAAMDGAATWVLLSALGTRSALFLGLMAGLLYTVPYLGALATVALLGSVAFVQGGLHYALIVVGANMVLHQMLFDQVIAPRVLGGHVGLHPVLTIVALLVGNLLLGIVGMLLAVPVAASIQTLVLALVPKLRHEIDLQPEPGEPPDTSEGLARETRDAHAANAASEDLHREVGEAVEAIEEAARGGDPPGGHPPGGVE